jgi:hypothetical protein
MGDIDNEPNISIVMNMFKVEGHNEQGTRTKRAIES